MATPNPAKRGTVISTLIGSQVAPRLSNLAPQLTSTFVREALQRAIDGVGPLAGAAETAEKALRDRGGNEERAIHQLIESHVRLAGGQGFLTNIGGIVTAPVAIPANLAGLAVLQCRLIAAIAHLRGHDLGYARVRLAVLATLMGEDRVDELVASMKLPAPPLALATAPAYDPALEKLVATTVAGDLIGGIAGKRMVTTVGRRIPVVGGVLCAGTDGYSTWRLGRYAEREFLRRSTR